MQFTNSLNLQTKPLMTFKQPYKNMQNNVLMFATVISVLPRIGFSYDF
jgi:hypothetical protein